LFQRAEVAAEATTLLQMFVEVRDFVYGDKTNVKVEECEIIN